MTEKKKVLIINYTQFGYHIDSFMYCRYAGRERLDLHYLCFDSGLEKVNCEGISIKYVKLEKSRLISYLKFFREFVKYNRNEGFDLVFHIDAKFTLVLRLLNIFNPMVLDIRTGDLSDGRIRRFVRNLSITISCIFYPGVSVITESLRKELRIPPGKSAIIPLGGELHKTNPKDFKTLQLLYVGTLEKRNIDHTVKGLALFCSKFPATEISYNIIGPGKEATVMRLTESIKAEGMQERVFYHGRKKHSEIVPFLERCNTGVVYIPCTKYYEVQSSTKFYEYVLAGMAVIATDTYENRMALREGSGYLCKDDPLSFADALERVYLQKENFDTELIRSMYLSNQWNRIVREIWEPFIIDYCR